MILNYPPLPVLMEENRCAEHVEVPDDQLQARSEAASDLDHCCFTETIPSTAIVSKCAATPRIKIPSLSPLSSAHTSDGATTMAVTRHHQSSPMFQPYSDSSPYSSTPSTAVNSRSPSPIKEFEGDEEGKKQDDITLAQCKRLKWRLASGFFAYFMTGWADGITGTVMPYLTAQFHMTSTLSSSLFAGTTCGFFAGTILVESIMNGLGTFRVCRCTKSFPIIFRHRRNAVPDYEVGYSSTQARYLVLMLASTIHASYFVLMGSRSGIPAMFLAYVLSAFSRALLSAPLNAYFAQGSKRALGYGTGLASLGSVISPLVCQSIIALGVPWYRFYYGSLVLSVCNFVFLGTTFKPTANESANERQKSLKNASERRRMSEGIRSSTEVSSPTDGNPGASTIELGIRSNSRSALRSVLGMPYQWAFSFFILLYCGSETATQGFMVTYLLSARHANPKTVGYVTSGFWGGISIGRFIWGYCIPLLTFAQRKYAVHACIGVAVLLHLTIWLVNSNIENATATSLIGTFYGPILPACLNMANDILPVEVHMVSMALINSFASLGGAVFPLVAGAILDAKGVYTLTFLTVPLAAAMACLWTFFPSRLPSRCPALP